jgi:enamine deaminase RidA (YjgF/YER057c/UK114 family)/diketogulonate reductase-like aldo/keto reductase
MSTDHSWDYTSGHLLPHMSHLRTLQDSGRIHLLGLTNTDAAHLELLCTSGFAIATNQVSCSVIDQRVVRGRLSTVCAEHNVRILAYGTLLGGYLSEKWLGAPEPKDLNALNWSLRKYLRFIHAAGGWNAYQNVLQALSTVAQRHGVPIAAVATRFVLDIPAVAAVIVGTRLSADSHKYVHSNLAAFSVTLTDEDRALVKAAQEKLTDIPGDCGDEYRRAPFLTATGDLSDHLEADSAVDAVHEAVAKGQRVELSSGSPWEPIAGYCRAVRIGSTVYISGTTANSTIAGIPALGGTSARAQTVAALDIIEGALKKLGMGLADVVRTRVILRREEDAKAVSEAHGWAFGCVGVRPSNTMIVAELIGKEYLVEIEAEAVVGGGSGVLRI